MPHNSCLFMQSRVDRRQAVQIGASRYLPPNDAITTQARAKPKPMGSERAAVFSPFCGSPRATKLNPHAAKHATQTNPNIQTVEMACGPPSPRTVNNEKNPKTMAFTTVIVPTATYPISLDIGFIYIPSNPVAFLGQKLITSNSYSRLFMDSKLHLSGPCAGMSATAAQEPDSPERLHRRLSDCFHFSDIGNEWLV